MWRWRVDTCQGGRIRTTLLLRFHFEENDFDSAEAVSKVAKQYSVSPMSSRRQLGWSIGTERAERDFVGPPGRGMEIPGPPI